MNEIQPTLHIEIPGILGVSDTHRTDKTGRWFVLVKQTAFIKTRKHITASLHEWISMLPDDLHDLTPTNFPPPHVSPKHADADHDDDSSGHASYMSSCAQSYGSFDDGNSDATYYHPPGSVFATHSYADAVKKPSRDPVETQHTPPDTDIELAAMDRELRAIIATLRNEVNILKNGTGLQTPSTVMEISTPETDASRLASRMDNIEQNITKWMSDMTILMQTQQSTQMANPSSQSKRPSEAHPQPHHSHASPMSHSSKRADTRRTPDRSDLMITQPDDSSSVKLFQDPEGNGYRSVRNPQGYDPNCPQYLYMDNGDGSLYSVGLAGPDDFDMNRIRRGLYHPLSQPTSPYTAPFSPQRPMRQQVTGSPQSLPVEGARPNND